MQRPNILLITFDSLRADYCYSKNTSLKKPNIDKLLSKAFCFTQAISTSDSTGNSIGSIFSGLYTFRSNITHFNFNKNIPLFTKNLKEHDYNLFSLVPDLSFFLNLTADFDKTETYVYDKRESWLQLHGGIGEQILQQLKFIQKHEPWFMFIHLMDLHAPFFIPKNFDKSEYGSNRYERMLSSIDTWIGKIMSQLDFENTLLIISSDHGDYVPIHDKEISYDTIGRRLIRKIKKIFPPIEPLTLKIYKKYVEFMRKQRIQNLKTSLSSDEIRTFNVRADENLFDESIMIPLLFYGYGVSEKKEITNQVRQIDIFPTILDICKIKINQKIDGRSLMPFFNNNVIADVPAVIETGSRDPKKLGSVIGVRTSQYKYLRSRNEPYNNIQLFDLKSDQYEKNNLAKSNPKLIQNMEHMLNEIMNNVSEQHLPEIDDDETKKIQEELKKLGYL